jgi:hypothetical protein
MADQPERHLMKKVKEKEKSKKGNQQPGSGKVPIPSTSYDGFHHLSGHKSQKTFFLRL